MSSHRLIISSAGSGKTTFLVQTALDNPDENFLITTYTENNEKEIRNKFIKKRGFVPKNVTIQTWFSFLIQHGVKPFQGILNDYLFEQDVKGMLLVSRQSGYRFTTKKGFPVYFGEEDFFERHYFTKDSRIYSDKLSKFIYKLNSKDDGSTFNRVSRIFDHIMIDEVQDLAGHDLEIIKLLMKRCTNVTMVGDPRQVTYLTHLEAKNKPYREGKVEEFLLQKCKSLIKDGVDKKTLVDSHRCSAEICNYATKLYPGLPPTTSCGCHNIVPNVHQGMFLIRPEYVDAYLKKYDPVQLKWSKSVKTNPEFSSQNFGESKGASFNRVMVYPTDKMKGWIENNTQNLPQETRAKLYVGITRARHSVAIIHDFNSDKNYDGMIKYQPEE